MDGEWKADGGIIHGLLQGMSKLRPLRRIDPDSLPVTLIEGGWSAPRMGLLVLTTVLVAVGLAGVGAAARLLLSGRDPFDGILLLVCFVPILVLSGLGLVASVRLVRSRSVIALDTERVRVEPETFTGEEPWEERLSGYEGIMFRPEVTAPKRGGNVKVAFVLELRHRNRERNVIVYESRTPEEAFGQWQKFSWRLGLPTVDEVRGRTEKVEVTTLTHFAEGRLPAAGSLEVKRTERKLTRAVRKFAVIVVVSGFGLLGLSYSPLRFVYQEIDRIELLQKRGERIDGWVIRKSVTSGRTQKHIVKYAFFPDGRPELPPSLSDESIPEARRDELRKLYRTMRSPVYSLHAIRAEAVVSSGFFNAVSEMQKVTVLFIRETGESTVVQGYPSATRRVLSIYWDAVAHGAVSLVLGSLMLAWGIRSLLVSTRAARRERSKDISP